MTRSKKKKREGGEEHQEQRSTGRDVGRWRTCRDCFETFNGSYVTFHQPFCSAKVGNFSQPDHTPAPPPALHPPPSTESGVLINIILLHLNLPLCLLLQILLNLHHLLFHLLPRFLSYLVFLLHLLLHLQLYLLLHLFYRSCLW